MERGQWVQDWSEYDFARLSCDRMNEMVRKGKEFLETLLHPVDPNYHCKVFRAANWSVCPSHNVIKALVEQWNEIDTSVFKYGRREGRVNFDYTSAFHQLAPWQVMRMTFVNKTRMVNFGSFRFIPKKDGLALF